MKKWNLIIDVAECTNCNLCTLATQDEYVGNAWPGVAAEMPRHGHRWIDIRRKERGQPPQVDVAYLPVMCQHCDDPPCMKAAKDGAVTKREDGIVIIDPVRAKGQRQIVDACPYGAVFWNEAQQLPQAWPFDAHLLDAGWTEPRAATVCPTGAFRAVKLEDEAMAERCREEGLEPLMPEAGTRPRVHYRNLHRFTRAFLAGQVTAMIDGIEECLVGAAVRLEAVVDKTTPVRETPARETHTDVFGDFRLDDLKAAGTRYRLSIRAEGRPPHERIVTLEDSLTLPVIILS